MNYDELISHYGTQEAAAAALGIRQSSVAEWKGVGIPLPRQAQYELVTDGALIAERPAPRETRNATQEATQ